MDETQNVAETRDKTDNRSIYFALFTVVFLVLMLLVEASFPFLSWGLYKLAGQDSFSLLGSNIATIGICLVAVVSLVVNILYRRNTRTKANIGCFAFIAAWVSYLVLAFILLLGNHTTNLTIGDLDQLNRNDIVKARVSQAVKTQDGNRETLLKEIKDKTTIDSLKQFFKGREASWNVIYYGDYPATYYELELFLNNGTTTRINIEGSTIFTGVRTLIGKYEGVSRPFQVAEITYLKNLVGVP